MITITSVAASKILDQLQRRGKGVGIRVGVRTTGCSGLAYKLEYVDNPTNDDIRFEQHGAVVFVDPKSMPYLEGMTVDYLKKGLNEGFEFINPNVKDQCGCGESFRV